MSLNTAFEALDFELAVFLYARFLLLPNLVVVILDYLALKFSLKRRILPGVDATHRFFRLLTLLDRMKFVHELSYGEIHLV